MQRIVWMVAIALFASLRLSADELVFDFAKDSPGKIPTGFTNTVSGLGKPGEWKLITDELPTPDGSGKTVTAPVVAQIARDPIDEHFPLLVYDYEVFGDFTFSCRFKTVAGQMEQMAGLVFRYQDEKNYYYVRASAKGNNFRFSKIVGGQRNNPTGPEIQVTPGVWHQIEVQCKGNQIFCFLDGKQAIPTLTDNSFSTGKVGFWTKSDSVTHFADAKIVFTPRIPLARLLLKDILQKYPRVLGMRIYSRPPGKADLVVTASTDETKLGLAASPTELQTVEENSPFYGKLKPDPGIVVTLPLHDRNGEVIAALRVEMKSFLGQTENNAVARAWPIAQEMEKRITEAKDLY